MWREVLEQIEQGLQLGGGVKREDDIKDEVLNVEMNGEH